MLVIGIGGGSGSGKTTLVQAIVSGLPGVAAIHHDSYYRHQPHLAFADRTRVNYDHPDSLETELLIKHLQSLKAGEPIERPSYDFELHLRANETETVQPVPALLVDGILVLADADLRAELDLKIYMDTDPDVKLARRLRRDTEERGRSAGSVLDQYQATVLPGYLEFVEPSKRYADLILPEGYNPRAVATVVDMIRSHLGPLGQSIYSPA